MYRKYVEQIINDGTDEDMKKLEEVFNTLMDHMEDCDSNLYEKLKLRLYIIANGKQLTEEMAKDIIMNMQPYHMKYTLNDAKNIMKDFELSLNPIDFWIVLNSAYNDYRQLFGENLDMYVKYSKLFIEDEDAKKGKVFTYFTEIPE